MEAQPLVCLLTSPAYEVQSCHPLQVGRVDVVLLVGEDAGHQVHVVGPLTGVMEGRHAVTVGQAEAVSVLPPLVERHQGLGLVLPALARDVYGVLPLQVGQHSEHLPAVCQSEVQQGSRNEEIIEMSCCACYTSRC